VNCIWSLVGLVHIDKTERALEEFLDVLLTDEFGSEQFVEIEIGKAAIRYACREQLQKQLGVNLTQGANFFKHDALRGIDELVGIDQAAKLDAGDGFYQHGAKESQQIAFGGGVFNGVGDGHRSWEEVASAGCAFSAVASPDAGAAGVEAPPSAVGSFSRIRFSTRCHTF